MKMHLIKELWGSKWNGFGLPKLLSSDSGMVKLAKDQFKSQDQWHMAGTHTKNQCALVQPITVNFSST